MNILILHPSFPGQFVYLAEALANNSENHVVFLTRNVNNRSIKGVRVAVYQLEREPSKEIHSYLHYAEEAVLDGQAVVRAIHKLKESYGFVPDLAIGHTGWGSMLYLKDYYPKLKTVGYFEWFYRALNSDAQWWDDETVSINGKLQIRTKNSHHLLSLDACDVRYTPTKWQHCQFPKEYQSSMRVIHDGVATDFLVPNKKTKLVLDDIGLDLSGCPEIVTYVSRGFEAYRGFPQFMDSIRILLKRRKDCHVVIVGNDQTCYGSKLKDKTYKEAEEEKGGYDPSRVHFVGARNRGDYLRILQASNVHIYLTRPFVLSWSLLEAMSIGCPLVASATPPVEEVVVDGENGLLVNFRSPEHIAFRVEELLENSAFADRLGFAARETILKNFDVRKCVREQINMIYALMK